MSVTIKTNHAAWKSAVEKASDFAAAALAEQMMSDSRPFIPDDGEHTLRDIGTIEKGERLGERNLVWNNVYAGYQWYGMRIDGTHVARNYTTPGTGKMWVEEARAKKGKTWEQVAQNGFNRGLK